MRKVITDSIFANLMTDSILANFLFVSLRLAALLALPFLLVSAALSAPAPRPKTLPPPHDMEGAWNLTWGTVIYELTLDHGRYSCAERPLSPGRPPWVRWEGSWTYDPGRGILRVHETSDGGENWNYWEVQIDSCGGGVAVYSKNELTPDPTKIRLERYNKVS